MSDYAAFLERRRQIDNDGGFAPVWMPDFLFNFQRALVEFALRKGRAAIFADCGLGKGQPDGALILTPSGFVTNTTLDVGDLVIASDGQPYPLTAKYERGRQPIYRVTFTDGAQITVDHDHLHILRTYSDRQRKRQWRVLSTSQLLDKRLRYGRSGNRHAFDIPVVAPVRFGDKPHWIHPYVLGVILGDGCITKRCVITLADQQILDTVSALLPTGWTLTKKRDSKYDYHLSKGGTTARDFISELRRLGILGTRSATKFIPLEYLLDSVDNRIWLLRGLMDTDGSIRDTSQFYSTSDRLASDVLFLIRSLGGVPTRSLKHPSCMHKGTRRIGAPCHILTFSLKTFNPFHLGRKATKWNPAPRDNGRWIDRIEPDGEARTICLSVGSPDQSYVTEHFVVTHNTPMQLVWGENVVRHTNGCVLDLTPLSVAAQTIREAEKFGIEAHRSNDGHAHPGITVTNYEKLDKFNPDDFTGVICDESGILKHVDSVRREAVTYFMRKVPYRLLCTATPSPNDYIELGNSSEALGQLGFMDMLSRFFKNDQNSNHPNRLWAGGAKWRFRGHAEHDFWRWVCSWSRTIQKPSDLGFDDGPFILPPLTMTEHVVRTATARPGMLFATPAVTLQEQRQERRLTMRERCEMVAALVCGTGQPAVSWCHLNDEGDLMESLIPDAVQVSGNDSDEAKEEKLLAFTNGDAQARVMISKSIIAGYGLNWQHCAHQTIFPSHSMEQFHHSLRRSWRFGQTRPVHIDMITSEGEACVLANLRRKAAAMDVMFARLVENMNSELNVCRASEFLQPVRVPAWP